MPNNLIPIYETKTNAGTPPCTSTRSEEQKKAGTPAIIVNGVAADKLSKVAFVVSILALMCGIAAVVIQILRG